MSSLAKAHYKSPSPPPSVRSTSSTSSSSSYSSSDSTNEQGYPEAAAGGGDDVIVPRVEEREYTEECEHDNVVYRVGDIVHLRPAGLATLYIHMLKSRSAFCVYIQCTESETPLSTHT